MAINLAWHAWARLRRHGASVTGGRRPATRRSGDAAAGKGAARDRAVEARRAGGRGRSGDAAVGAVLVFSEANRPYTLTDPSSSLVDDAPLLRARPRVHDCEPEALRRAADEAKVEVARLRDVAGRRFWGWEATNVEALGEAELPEFDRALGRLRGAVVRRRAL
uniref:MADS-box domain-containing protein n=1 Tax=Oryza barthii TaxID=65489 RepID=A0A0D3FN07_9ORYZ